jgi:peptide chain release factor 2
MQPLLKRINDLSSRIDAAFERLKIDEKKKQAADLQEELSHSEIWNSPTLAGDKSKRLAALTGAIDPWVILKTQANDITELIEIGDDSMLREFETQISALEKEYDKLHKDLMFKGEYDDRDAIIRLSAGVGGSDAQDWAEMLERMYLRWAERANMKTEIVERSESDEAGIKSSVIEVSGPFAYGKLRGENGVHRLVRLSPFNSDNLRQTSFALVEVLPQINTPGEVKVDPKEIKVDVYRSGGHGGQSVNTTDSAVRVTHIPTGIVVAIQNERSQLQNRETAMKLLLSKLTQLQLEQHAASISELHAGESANWGSQIRNYVMHPYTLVKDTRTKHEERNVQSVLDGKIDGFIDAYLRQN